MSERYGQSGIAPAPAERTCAAAAVGRSFLCTIHGAIFDQSDGAGERSSVGIDGLAGADGRRPGSQCDRHHRDHSPDRDREHWKLPKAASRQAAFSVSACTPFRMPGTRPELRAAVLVK